MSSLNEDFENIILECHYNLEINRFNQKEVWKELEQNTRATDVYRFLIEKEVSKAVVAQQFAKYLLVNKARLKEVLLTEPSIKLRINAIYHVTGGEDGAI